MGAEKDRLQDPDWKCWGPYVSNRQWGTVREDYSHTGDAWNATTYESAMSNAYRWSEDGIAGICGPKQRLCLAPAFWNGKDSMLKERFFGLSNPEGNHGEDVKELFFYRDSSPTHSYMSMLYKYPAEAFPYEELRQRNTTRSKNKGEYELQDTGIFDHGYFDILIEYAKGNPTDILMRITVKNVSEGRRPIFVLPMLWYRNNWSWGHNSYKPNLRAGEHSFSHAIQVVHEDLSLRYFYSRDPWETLFCDNESHTASSQDDAERFYKDGINDFLLYGSASINAAKEGTKACFLAHTELEPGEERVFEFRLSNLEMTNAFEDFNEIFDTRRRECDEFYAEIQKDITDEEDRKIQRQAFAGLLWNKQFYHYNVAKWLHGDPNFPIERYNKENSRNSDWQHMQNKDIISMPDKWEYPWFATWDLAFHCVPLALIDPDFAKQQLRLITKEWYIHPNGQLPAYEWNFGDVNPPVHAWSTFRVFKMDEVKRGAPDVAFLESVFQKLLLNFTWWVNRKDKRDNNIFGGGFLGLDNIGAFDRNMEFKNGQHLEQADGTSWMAMYALNMMRIAMELAKYNMVYEDMAIKFFEHYLYIAQAMEHIGNYDGLWNEEDGFFYDVLQMVDGSSASLRLRSMVGLIPMFAVEVVDHELLERLPGFRQRMDWILKNKPELKDLVSHWEIEGKHRKHLMSILRRVRLKKLVRRMLDSEEFLSDFGIRSMSKVYEHTPYQFTTDGKTYTVNYLPAESDSTMFGGNSNWRGPIWFPVNYLIIESLQRYSEYYGDDLTVPGLCHQNENVPLSAIATGLAERLVNLFRRNAEGIRPAYGADSLLNDPAFNKDLLFYEYFDGNTGKGLGASHQCGWTAVVAELISQKYRRLH